MQTRWCFRVLAVPVVVLITSLASTAAYSQNVAFAGKVTGQGGQPLAGASVTIPEIGVGGVAAEDGKYSFTVDEGRIKGRAVNLVARFIGYKPKRLPITSVAGSVTKDFVLDRDILNLEAVVVTGTSEATSQRKTPFSVNVVDATEMKEVPAVSSPVAALEGKVAGASVVTTSGQPGSAPAIRLRSATSLTGRQDPLIIIDGTITRLSMADINAEDIERIEVIKGAAASSLYGSDAANGVVQIFTKRGGALGEGQSSLMIRTEGGQSQLPNLIATNMHHNYKVSKDASGKVIDFARSPTGDRVSDDDKIADNAYPVLYDQYRKVFKPGNFITSYASVGQRRGRTNFNGSFQTTRDQGVLDLLKGFRRENFRMNVDHSLSDKFDMGMGAFYARSNADQGEDTGIFFGMRFIEPNIKLDSVVPTGPFAGQYNPKIKQPPLSGNVSNPLYVLQQSDVSDSRDRFTGTFRAAYRPLTWLTIEGNVGYDQSGVSYKSYFPLGFASSDGNQGKGSLFERSNSDRSWNTGLSAATNFTWRSVRNTTKGAILYEDQTNALVSVNAPALTVPKVTEFSAAAQDPNNPITPGSLTETIRAKNVFLISTFDVKDRYIIDGLIRRDQSSLFGADERSQTYHRVSGAYRLTQDVHIPGVDELKLRVSHGTAGLRPPFTAQYETFAISGGVPEKVTLGNRDLKPAFSRETEYGFEVNFLRNYTFEYTYSEKRTTDEIIKVPLSAASGYQTQWRNAGTLDGNSHEAALGAVLLSRADYFWRVHLTADRTRTNIADLKVGPFLIGPDENDPNTQIFKIAKGERLGTVYGSKWIRSQSQLEETIRAKGLTGTTADYVLNEEGFYVRKSAYHTIGEAPLKARSCTNTDCTTSATVVKIGDVNPDFNLGFTNTAQWKGITLSGTLTWTKGGNIYNYTRQWPFNELRDAVIDQSGKPDPGPCAANWATADPTCPYKTGRKPTTYYSTFYNNFDPSDYFVENGGYIRLREMAVNYEIPAKLVQRIPVIGFRSARIGVVGRNLWTQTDYSGYDPDVTGPGGGNPFAYRVDYFTYPAYRTFTAMFELGF